VKLQAEPWETSRYDGKPVKQAADLLESAACFTGFVWIYRLLPGLTALGFILSPAEQAEACIKICVANQWRALPGTALTIIRPALPFTL
jgi:hypothetical protein